MQHTENNRNISYKIQASKLQGKVKVSGAKNSVLRLLAASLLNDRRVELSNYPHTLRDAQIHLGMLEALGKKCEVIEGETESRVIITEPDQLKSELVWEGRSIRNTLLILGCLTARTGRGVVPLPGGCKLGERKYDLHVMLLEALGAKVSEDDENLIAEAPNGLVGSDIYLPMRSTGATENAIMCGCLAKGKTTIWGPHIRPEIIDLVKFLRKMGAEIHVFGQERIEVYGIEKTRGITHRVIADNMEALTWLVAAVVTGGDIEIDGFPVADLEIPLSFLRESGAEYYISQPSVSGHYNVSPDESKVIVRGGNCYPVEIATGPFPGINSDMQPLFAVYGAMAKGESRIIDLRFPGRYAYAEELAKLGMAFEVEGNLLKILGGNSLTGQDVTATDLRAGIALSIAGLVAEGTTTVHSAWQVERGYDRFISKLKALGGNIELIEE